MSDLSTSISAVLPVKNGEVFLDALLPSILQMLEPLDELIIVNDGSTDSTQEIIYKHAKIDSRLRFVTTKGIGLVNSLNLGVNLSTKDWIARFDADDSYSSMRLHVQRDSLMPGIAVVFSDYRFLSTSRLSIGTVRSPVFPNPTTVSLIASQRTAHPSAVINREKLLLVGGYLAQDFPAEDLGLWLRLSSCGELISAPQILLGYRLSKNSISSSNRKLQLAKAKELSSDYANWQDVYSKAQSEFVETVSAYLLLPGGPERVFHHIRELKMIERKLTLNSNYLTRLLSIGYFSTVRVGLAGIRSLVFAMGRRIYRRV
jgi:glycosyltransferase involved in cell wall biosynthesis